MPKEANPGHHRHLGATLAMTAVAAASPAQQNEGTKEACGWRGWPGQFDFPEEELTRSVHHWKQLPPGRSEPLLLGVRKQGAPDWALWDFQASSLIQAVPTPALLPGQSHGDPHTAVAASLPVAPPPPPHCGQLLFPKVVGDIPATGSGESPYHSNPPCGSTPPPCPCPVS